MTRCAAPSWGAEPMRAALMATALTLSALPALAQDAAPNEALPPVETETLPPAGEAPVDEIAPISDVAPDGGVPDADAVRMGCTFQTECMDTECSASGYEGWMTVMSDGAGMAEVEWDDPSESVAMSAVTDGGILLASSTGTEAGRQRMLTVLPDGQARFTTHLTDPPMAITYLGECK